MKLAIVIALFAACSHDDPELAAKVTRALDGLGDQIAADARAAIANPPKSRIGVVEIFAEVTPVALPRHAATLARFGVTPIQVVELVHAHPDTIDHMLSRAQPAIDELAHAVEVLPAADPGECDALAKRVAVLEAGPDRAYGEMLATALPTCAQGSGSPAPPPAAAN
ncbi:MAG TPA: hypothetical protein VH143_09045 [Kofleriaceae bacterium]|jgi:hypothetical protein|nr:hypothetical protein [Kofleriaceae bacterium]